MSSPVPLTHKDAKLPVWRVITLCIINFNESLQGNIVWPILAYAVQRWGASDDNIGLYVGLLASSFFLAQCLFVAAWGKAADVFGRRPTLLVGLFGTALSMTLFGFARSFTVALLARFLTGALNGNVAIAKTYMGEITNSSTQARAFAWLSFTWGFGGILAPALGGWLSEPAENYPTLFGDSDFFKAFPYVLPSLLSAAFSVTAFVFGYFALPETEAFLARKRALTAVHERVAGSEEEAARMVVSSDDAGNGHSRESEETTLMVSRRRGDSVHGRSDLSGATGSVASSDSKPIVLPPLKHLRTAALGQDADASLGTPSKLPRHPGAALAAAAHAVVRSVQPGRTSEEATPSSGDNAAPEAFAVDASVSPPLRAISPRVTAGAEGPVTLRDLLADRAVMVSVGLYALLSLAQILFDELLPVFCKTSVEHGGLGFPSSRVGSLQVVAGATQITMQLGVIPILVPRFGPINCFRFSMWPLVVLILFPSVAHIADRPELLWPALALGVVVKTSMMSISFTSIMLLINNSSRGRGLGLINGLAQGVASGVRTVGPSVGGALFSASLSWMWLGVLRMHVVYALQTLAVVIGALCSTALPAWVDAAPRYDHDVVERDAASAAPAAEMNGKHTKPQRRDDATAAEATDGAGDAAKESDALIV